VKRGSERMRLSVTPGSSSPSSGLDHPDCHLVAAVCWMSAFLWHWQLLRHVDVAQRRWLCKNPTPLVYTQVPACMSHLSRNEYTRLLSCAPGLSLPLQVGVPGSPAARLPSLAACSAVTAAAAAELRQRVACVGNWRGALRCPVRSRWVGHRQHKWLHSTLYSARVLAGPESNPFGESGLENPASSVTD
jgi:hypothetical protein